MGWSDDEDDDMADLFSFGADDAPTPETASTGAATAAVTSTTTTATGTASTASSNHHIGIQHDDDDILAVPDARPSDDSFLNLLDSDLPPTYAGNSANNTTAKAVGTDPATTVTALNDKETQDILNWLDEDEVDNEVLLIVDESPPEVTTAKIRTTKPNTTNDKQEPLPISIPLPPPPPEFASLKEALESSEATKPQLIQLFEQEHNSGKLKEQISLLRPQLWCRILSGKRVEELETSSMADSLTEFTPPKDDDTQQLQAWVRVQSAKLAPRMVRTCHNLWKTMDDAEQALQNLLLYHCYQAKQQQQQMQQQQTEEKSSSKQEAQFVEDPLLPPVVCALLSAGIPKLATHVLLNQYVMSTCMPFLALTQDERWEAAQLLHTQFYLLACYHIPMLVYHLDRYVPGWYWPRKRTAKEQKDSNYDNHSDQENHAPSSNNTATHKGRNLQDQGVIPPSWLMTHLAGECDADGSLLDPQWVLQLWDVVFTTENNSLRFFLALAMMEQHSDRLLDLTDGEQLLEALHQMMELREFHRIEATNGDESPEAASHNELVEEWTSRARALKSATPDSVVDRLRTAEDDAVKQALKERQKRAEAQLKARLEAEARAHKEAQERKAEDARNRLTRARLVAFYRRFAPDKEANVDKIMDAYKDRYDDLDKKLKKKYGVGFNPALNPNRPKKTTSIASVKTAADASAVLNEGATQLYRSMNQGLESARNIKFSSMTKKSFVLEDDEEDDETRKRNDRVCMTLKVAETLPFICMSREQANDIRRVCLQKDLPMPLRFYMVDARSDEVVGRQGRFPSAARLSPKALMDPEQLQKYEDEFESVRGSKHICVMGEGYSAIPALYSQKLSPKLEAYVQEDESRTNNAALYFVKRGFPYVSVLEGGFASAHAWIVREGSKSGFDANALLTEYQPTESLFGQLEKLRNDQLNPSGYGARDRAARAMHNLLEASVPDTESQQSSTTLSSLNFSGSQRLPKLFSTTTTTTTANQETDAAGDSLVEAPIDSSAGNTGLKGLFGRKSVARSSSGEKVGGIFGVRRTTSQAATDGDAKADSSEGSDGDDGTPATDSNATSGRFSKWRQAAASAINAKDEAVAETQGPTTAAPASAQAAPTKNRFGFGSVLQSARVGVQNSEQAQKMLKRNPFARFGGGNAAPATANTAATPPTTTSVKPPQSSAPEPAPTVVALPPAPAEDSPKD